MNTPKIDLRPPSTLEFLADRTRRVKACDVRPVPRRAPLKSLQCRSCRCFGTMQFNTVPRLERYAWRCSACGSNEAPVQPEPPAHLVRKFKLND